MPRLIFPANSTNTVITYTSFYCIVHTLHYLLLFVFYFLQPKSCTIFPTWSLSPPHYPLHHTQPATCLPQKAHRANFSSRRHASSTQEKLRIFQAPINANLSIASHNNPRSLNLHKPKIPWHLKFLHATSL